MIRGNSVILRAMEPQDVDLMMIYENDTEIWPVSGTLVPYSRYTLEQFYKNAVQDIYTARQLRLAIELIKEAHRGQTIGYVDLFDFDPQQRRAGVGILIGDKRERNKGYASEALMLLCRYSFEVLNIHQLFCHIDNNNEASLNLFEKAGFKKCGLLKDWILFDGQWRDVNMLQLLRPKPVI
jgi:diamine N-acetyltransferase